MLPFRNPLQGATASRRQFLIGAAAAAGGLAVGYSLMRAGPAGAQAQEAAINPFAAYVEITPDDRVIIHSSQFDMGQGSYFGIATLVMEELGGDWSTVEVVGASGDPKLYGNLTWGGVAQGTGGSSSIVSSWERYRRAGATARAMLVAAAAEAWSVREDEITVSAGVLGHPSGRSARFGEHVGAAAGRPVPPDVALKAPHEWTQIGAESLRRYDSPAKTNGTHDFTIDVKLDGMLTAVMIHPPKFGATLRSFDAAQAKAVDGIVDVVETPRGIAVVGRDMWTALKGRDLVTAEWDETAAETRGTEEIMALYRSLAAGTPAAMARNDGDTGAAIAGAARTFEATYEFPFLAHAALEPMNAVARMNGDGTLEVWGGHQMPDLYQAVAAQVAGIGPEKVRLHVMKTGGSFGRRAVPDSDVIVEAVATARALGWRAPVKVQWTRDNDMRAGRYRPAYVHALKAGVDADGTLVALSDHIVGQSILSGTPFEPMLVRDGVDGTTVEGAANLPYAVANLAVGVTATDVTVPVLWWRSVGSTHTAFAIETFLDEIAAATGRDPVEMRLEMLDRHPRHAEVLRLAAEKAGWGTPLPEDRFRGVALHESFSTYVAQVAEIVADGNGGYRVDRVVCAVDCGIAVNPDQIRAQMEGSIGFGLGAVMDEEVTLTGGVVDQENYDTYMPLRIDAMPRVEVHIVSSRESPTGVGEPGVPPIGPAVANALRAATGRPIRTLPIARAQSA